MVLNAQTIEDRADIDPAYQDADGEPDSQVPNQFPASPVTKPMGIRQADGTVVPYASPKAIAVPVSVDFHLCWRQSLNLSSPLDRRKEYRRTTCDHPNSLPLTLAEGAMLKGMTFKMMIGIWTLHQRSGNPRILSQERSRKASSSLLTCYIIRD
jgi:hypothetical protein